QVGSGGITRFSFPGFLNEITVNPLHTITTTGSLTSTGGINFNGPDLDTPPGFGPFDGGQLTLDVPSLSFGSSPNDNIQGPVSFNGGATTGPQGAGSGGIFTVNAAGLITVDSPIEATTGLQPDAMAPSGTGGTVNLNSASDTVTINSRVQVSSADSPSGAPRRRSADGGDISVTSGKQTGVAINITSSGQLLSLLENAPVNKAGKVTILATGPSSQINISGPAPAPTPSIAASKGTVEVRHDGGTGQIALTDVWMSADVLKVGALGSDGTLTLSGGTRLDGDSQVLLYAGSSNGTISVLGTVRVNSLHTFLRATTITVDSAAQLIVNSPSRGTLEIFANTRNWGSSGPFGPILFNGHSVGTATGMDASGAVVDGVNGSPGHLPPGF
ncbi:MAG TPA: hypothetical protein VJS88_05275, partial [Chthoniobacterales bacterium]|nr:hypothetical protein [Chthoniobacterales bacterium]